MNLIWTIRRKLIVWLAGNHSVILNTRITVDADKPTTLCKPILCPEKDLILSRCEFVLRNVSTAQGIISTTGLP